MNISWYPGHMVVALREIQNILKYIDIAVVVLDARIPFASMNKQVYNTVKDKTVIIVFNKADLADKEKLNKAEKKYKSEGAYIVRTNSLLKQGIKELKDLIKELGSKIKYKDKTSLEYLKLKKIYRVVIVGIPNSGKSTLINSLSSRMAMTVGNKPGVTKKKQWTRIDKEIEIMDTPGLMDVNVNKEESLLLALTGNIKEEILDQELLAFELLKIIRKNKLYLSMLKSRYNLEEDIENLKEIDVVNLIGFSKGVFAKGGIIDTLKTSKMILDDYKSGKIGSISLE